MVQCYYGPVPFSALYPERGWSKMLNSVTLRIGNSDNREHTKEWDKYLSSFYTDLTFKSSDD